MPSRPLRVVATALTGLLLGLSGPSGAVGARPDLAELALARRAGPVPSVPTQPGPDRAWTLRATYVDVCGDAPRVDLRDARVVHDTHGTLTFRIETCAPFSVADLGDDGAVVWRLFEPEGRGDGQDHLVAVYADGADLAVEVIATPTDDPATWTTTWADTVPVAGSTSRIAFDVPVSAVADATEFLFDLFSADRDRTFDDLPELYGDLLAFPFACSLAISGRARLQAAADPGSGFGPAVPVALGPRYETAPVRGGWLDVRRADGGPLTPADLDGLARRPGVERLVTPILWSRAQVVPDDPGYPDQWALHDIGAESAWAARTGSGLTVAVIDDGIDGTLGAFGGRVVAGRDTVWDVDLPAGADSDLGGHGTAVAGIIAAAGDDGQDLAGIDWRARVLPLRVFDAAGCATDFAIADAIDTATTDGADVINLSLGGEGRSPLVEAAIDRATATGVIVVAAAGNQREAGNPTIYPAAYPPVVAVGATTRSGTPARYSGTGPWIDVVAPGGAATGGAADISVLGRDGIETAAGTSFAAPMVAGAALLWRADHPARPPSDFARDLSFTARDVGLVGSDPFTGAGRLDLAALLPSPPRLGWGPQVSAATGPSPRRPVTTDLDDDGATDAVVIVTDALETFRGNGDGTMAPVGASVLTGARAAAVGRFAGDAAPDVAAIASGSDEVTLFPGLGDGSLGAGAVLATVGARPVDLVTLDVGGDGLDDLVTANADDGTLTLVRQTAPGVFAVAQTLSLGATATPRALAVGDLDDDAHDDVVVATSDGLRALHGAPSGLLSIGDDIAPTNRAHVGLADITGDGRDDAISVRATGGAVAVDVHPRSGASSFGPVRTTIITGTATDLDVGDLDVDGRADVLVATTSGVTALRGEPDATLAGASIVTGGAAGVAIAELDGLAPAGVVAVGSGAVLRSIVGRDVTAPRVWATPGNGSRGRDVVSVRLHADGPESLHWTTDPDAPTGAFATYGGPISLVETATVRFFGEDAAGNRSHVHTAGYVVGAPEVTAVFPEAPDEQQEATFGATGPDGVSYAWDTGDGGASAEPTFTYRYAQQGGARATLTAVAPDGSWVVLGQRVDVHDGGLVERVAGDDRVRTAVAVSQRYWSAAHDVVIATARDHPDALAGGALAATLGAPILLTEPGSLPAVVAEELGRLGAARVWLLGGTRAISADVEAALADLVTVRRVAGEDRYATAAAVAREVGASSFGEVTLALGTAFPDAVAAGALAGSRDRLPTLLTTRTTVPPATLDALADLDVRTIFLVGGPAVIDDAVVATLEAAGYEVHRLWGEDRYATSAAVATEAVHRFPFDSPTVAFATGEQFPDALAAAGAVAAGRGPLLLVPPGSLDNAESIREHLEFDAAAFDVGVLVGGPSAVSGDVAAALARAMDTDER